MNGCEQRIILAYPQFGERGLCDIGAARGDGQIVRLIYGEQMLVFIENRKVIRQRRFFGKWAVVPDSQTGQIWGLVGEDRAIIGANLVPGETVENCCGVFGRESTDEVLSHRAGVRIRPLGRLMQYWMRGQSQRYGVYARALGQGWCEEVAIDSSRHRLIVACFVSWPLRRKPLASCVKV